MEALWLLDRASGLLAYPALWAAVVTGIFYEDREFGRVRDVSHAIHVPVATLATLLVLGHGVVGTLDVLVVAAGAAPVPAYGLDFLVVGALVGVGALVVVVVAALAFLDPLRAARPWSPRVVHAFAYAGYAFATVHGVAVGTDVSPGPNGLILAGVGVVAALLVVREVVRSGVVAGPVTQ